MLRKSTLQIQQLGGSVRGNYKFRATALIVGLEVGGGSGPQNGDPRGELNFRRAREKPSGLLNTDGLINLRSSRGFTFDPDYHVDMILFRRILGTVYNATYMKPSVTYWLIDSFGGQAGLSTRWPTNRRCSLVTRSTWAPKSTRLMYHNKDEGFYAALEHGVRCSTWGPGRRSRKSGTNVPRRRYDGAGLPSQDHAPLLAHAFRCAISVGLVATGPGLPGAVGTPCQGASDCQSGLLCVKPPGFRAGASGVCEQARRGVGEPVPFLRTVARGLVCSNRDGGGYYGMCQPAVYLDGGGERHGRMDVCAGGLDGAGFDDAAGLMKNAAALAVADQLGVVMSRVKKPSRRPCVRDVEDPALAACLYLRRWQRNVFDAIAHGFAGPVR